MQETTSTTEATTVKAGRTKASWEMLGVKFRLTFRSRSCMSLRGKTGEPYMTWSAWHKGEYLVGSGGSLDSFIELMNTKEERIMGIISRTKSKK